jgi:hypothetical protein
VAVITFSKVRGTGKRAHQIVDIDGKQAGEVWQEQANVNVSKLTAPRKTALKWRWFAKAEGSVQVIGRGTRAAMILGPGFTTRDGVVAALARATDTSTAGSALATHHAAREGDA